jgi:large subunit ribosomal protein L23
MYQVIKKPLVTEKNTIHSTLGTYVFEVDRKATKVEVKQAIEKLFDVKVNSVKTMVCRDRSRRVGAKYSKIKYWKKALVKLQAGQKIAVFEGV